MSTKIPPLLEDHSLNAHLVIDRVRRIRQIEHDAGVRLGTSPGLSKLLLEINRAVEVQASIRVDIDVQRFVISWGVDDADISSLHKVISDNYVFLIWGYFDVVRTDGGLHGVGVVETLDVVEIGDVEGGDVVCGGEGEVGELSVLCQVGAEEDVVSCLLNLCETWIDLLNGDDISCSWSQIVEELSNTLLASVVVAEWIDDPDLTEVNSSSKCSRFIVAGDEFDILNSTSL